MRCLTEQYSQRAPDAGVPPVGMMQMTLFFRWAMVQQQCAAAPLRLRGSVQVICRQMSEVGVPAARQGPCGMCWYEQTVEVFLGAGLARHGTSSMAWMWRGNASWHTPERL